MDKLFVYGTLHPDRAPAEIADVVRQLKPLGAGTIRAARHQFRDYPAIRMNSKNATKVAGHVFGLADSSDLKDMDEYEGYYPEALSRSLFIRTTVNVRLESGEVVKCWVYEYNRPLPPVKQVRRTKGRP